MDSHEKMLLLLHCCSQQCEVQTLEFRFVMVISESEGQGISCSQKPVYLQVYGSK